MENMITIPRQALVELLRASGSTLTPEQYLASLPDARTTQKYAGRTSASAWSKGILLVAALVSGIWTCLPVGFGIEGIIITIGLGVVTFFEYRVNDYFRTLNLKAPDLGFRNQSAFAAAILLYGLYHAMVPYQMSSDMQGFFEQSNVADLDMLRNLTRVFYLIIGVTGGISQFGLAWYYRSARAVTKT
jgi:hypothetical protein